MDAGGAIIGGEGGMSGLARAQIPGAASHGPPRASFDAFPGMTLSHKPYDDFKVGDVVDSLGRTLTETDCVLFTGLAGIKAPIFIDEEFCRKHSPFGGRIVPGLLTMSIAVGQLEEVLGPYVIAALSLDAIRFVTPAKPGDTIHTRLTVVGKRDTSDGKRGIFSIHVQIFNQHDQTVVQFDNTLMMRRGAL